MDMKEKGWVKISPLPANSSCYVREQRRSDGAARFGDMVKGDVVGVVPICLVWLQSMRAGAIDNSIGLYAAVDGRGELINQGDYILVDNTHVPAFECSIEILKKERAICGA